MKRMATWTCLICLLAAPALAETETEELSIVPPGVVLRSEPLFTPLRRHAVVTPTVQKGPLALVIDSRSRTHLLDPITGKGVLVSRKKSTDSKWSADGTLLAAIDRDRSLRVRRVESRALVTRVERVKGDAAAFAIAPDSTTSVAFKTDQTLRMQRADGSNQLVFKLDQGNRQITSCTYSPDGKRFYTVGRDFTIRAWSTKTGRMAFKIEGRHHGKTPACLSPNGRVISTVSRNQELQVWSTEDGHRIMRVPGFVRGAYSPDSKNLLVRTTDGLIRAYSLSRNGRTLQIRLASFPATSAKFVGETLRLLLQDSQGNQRLYGGGKAILVRSANDRDSHPLPIWLTDKMAEIPWGSSAGILNWDIELGRPDPLAEPD